MFDVYISDVNDEYPEFENEPYRLEIPEVSKSLKKKGFNFVIFHSSNQATYSHRIHKVTS